VRSFPGLGTVEICSGLIAVEMFPFSVWITLPPAETSTVVLLVATAI
jgi:hypothetical protein